MGELTDWLGSGVMPIVVAVVVVGALVKKVLDHRADARRREELFALAHQRGLRYHRRDLALTLALGFDLFRQGDGRGIENVLHGELDGHPVRAFDYWYYDEHRDQEGHRTRTYHRFTCAVSPVEGLDGPHLTIAPESWLSRVTGRLGGADIRFESDDFNRAFRVRCDDRRYAHAVVDARMMTWLLSTGGRFEFELRGSHVLCAAERVETAQEFVLLHQVSRLLVERIPSVTRSLYPARATAATERPRA